MFIVQTVLVIFIMLAFVSVPAWAQGNGWEKKWNKILAAAKKEGKVVVKGDDDPKTRLELPARFTAKFGIPVEYIGGRSSKREEKRQRRAERNATDDPTAPDPDEDPDSPDSPDTPAAQP